MEKKKFLSSSAFLFFWISGTVKKGGGWLGWKGLVQAVRGNKTVLSWIRTVFHLCFICPKLIFNELLGVQYIVHNSYKLSHANVTSHHGNSSKSSHGNVTSHQVVVVSLLWFLLSLAYCETFNICIYVWFICITIVFMVNNRPCIYT